MAQYLLGIDNGLTVAKAALFDLNGSEVAVASKSLPVLYPHPGWTERDLAEMWRSTAEVIREVLAKAGVDGRSVVAVGNSGHGNGIYLLDKQGRPLGNGILSMDSRANDVVKRWNEQGLHEKAFPLTAGAFWAAQPNALLAWMKENQRERYDQIGAILLCKDYVKWCLTGTITTDYTDISGSSLFDVGNRRYDKGLLELYGIPEVYEALPPCVDSHAVVGRVTAEAAALTGLAEGTPVVGGLFDVCASALGAGVTEPDEMCIVSGTWSINEVVLDHPVFDPNLFMMVIHAVPGRWLAVEASPTSATNLEWFVNNLAHEEQEEAKRRGVSVYAVCDEKVAKVSPKETDVLFHPFLYGCNTHPDGRAGFYGIGGWHSKEHLLRALYEGVVFCHRDHVDRLRRAGITIRKARLTGGGSRSVVWTQIFADVIGLPMEVVGGKETGARGVAISAGIGAGVYKSYQEAVQQAVKVERVQDPQAEYAGIYQKRYEIYQALAESMKAPWERMAQLAQNR